MMPPEIAQMIKDFFAKRWLVIVIVISCIIAGYVSVIVLGKDNPVEQDVELVIETETGIKIDLTPSN